jgi:hypothetical protein
MISSSPGGRASDGRRDLAGMDAWELEAVSGLLLGSGSCELIEKTMESEEDIAAQDFALQQFNLKLVLLGPSNKLGTRDSDMSSFF